MNKNHDRLKALNHFAQVLNSDLFSEDLENPCGPPEPHGSWNKDLSPEARGALVDIDWALSNLIQLLVLSSQ